MAKGGWRYGAGRPGWKGKAEHRTSLDVRRLQREGILTPGRWTGWQWSEDGKPYASIGMSVSGAGDRLTLSYRWTPHGGEPVDVECPIRLETTPCNYGGVRVWFACPQCGWRCAVVYFGGRVYACRRCLNLAYASQADDETGRTWRKQRKIERKLSGGAGEWNRWQKPKGMHQKTFDKLRHQIYECEARRDELLCILGARLFPYLFEP